MDAFEILSLPRRAALSDEALQRVYAERSRTAHPDHGGTETLAAQVNEAVIKLRNPDQRLKHLMELSAPDEARAWRAVPLDDEMMEVFMSLGRSLEASERFLQKKASATSALAKALLAPEELRHRESLEALGISLGRLAKQMEARLPALDEALALDDAAAWKELAALQARFAYVSKWQSQIRERLLSLM